MTRLYTIGFTKKSARKFFDLLQRENVKEIVDTRINNTSQLSGFAKGKDLEFFAQEIGGIDYSHELLFAPTQDMLKAYRRGDMTWDEYEEEYISLLGSRDVKNKVKVEDLDHRCFLCSEHSPEYCHRRLLAEYLQSFYPSIEIVHLK